MNLSRTLFAAGLAATLGFGTAAQAAIVDAAALAADSNADIKAVGQALTGAANSDFDNWAVADIVGTANPGFNNGPGIAAWPGGIGSGTGGDAAIYKTANGAYGGPYAASASIYFGGYVGGVNVDGGSLSIQDATPLADVQTIVFQIEIAEVTGYDFYNEILPVLSINGGAGQAASFSAITAQVDNGVFQTPEGPETIYINTYLLAWDLGAAGLNVTDPVTSLAIDFSGVLHAQIYGLRLDQSDAGIEWPQDVTDPVTPAVPEPATAGLLALGGAAMLLRRRK